MAQIEIDGKQVTVADGSTIIEAAEAAGVYIPRFCFHKKLSIAANCRMCLVEVEKAGKPLPACATPVIEGMKIFTHSEKAVQAQKSVMEFLLINHPLDCPICDQGGECQLQDLAVGYGGVSSRYQEEKRVVFNKDFGPLIAGDMTRCIQCTRCVRFGQEIAGQMEMGMAHRGEHSEITTFVGRAVASELSGNMIDLCPVGALTSKPFRYSARTWELTRRPAVAPHDGLGSNVALQVKQNRVYRVLPRDNDAVNECWLSDRDRFSYEGLYSEDRLNKPMIKEGGQWRECEWKDALEYAANSLNLIRQEVGAEQLGALASPSSTVEELYLLKKLMTGLGSGNVDHRLRHSDFSADAYRQGAPWLGRSVASLQELDRVLLIGSSLRSEQPLLAQRLRQAVKRGAHLNVVHVADDALLCRVAHKLIVAPDALAQALAQVVKALGERAAVDAEVQPLLAGIEVSETARSIAASLTTGENRSVLLGNVAQHHPRYALLHRLAQEAARLSGAAFGVLGEAANSVGAYLAGALPAPGGLNAGQMLATPRKAYILLGVELERDSYNGQQAMAAMQGAFVVALTAYKHRAHEFADVLLPIAAFAENAGTYVNTEGVAQSFRAAVAPRGEARPAWKVLRVLGNLFELDGFSQDNAEALTSEALGNTPLADKLGNALRPGMNLVLDKPDGGRLQRIGEVGIYQTDSLVRRAASLQKMSAAPRAWMHNSLLAQLGLSEDETVTVRQGDAAIQLSAACDDTLPAGCVRVAAGHEQTALLGGLFDEIRVEKSKGQQQTAEHTPS
ncbi:MAG: NADH-quinone oxidoreductase subunit NuoG [Sulfuricellaceae bacterium]|nr:NADH-quinone oxidoreductase subunit NuoG [Sulfuricellaceae bacterium]